MAQRKRAGLITRRTLDRNQSQLDLFLHSSCTPRLRRLCSISSGVSQVVKMAGVSFRRGDISARGLLSFGSGTRLRCLRCSSTKQFCGRPWSGQNNSFPRWVHCCLAEFVLCYFLVQSFESTTVLQLQGVRTKSLGASCVLDFDACGWVLEEEDLIIRINLAAYCVHVDVIRRSMILY